MRVEVTPGGVKKLNCPVAGLSLPSRLVLASVNQMMPCKSTVMPEGLSVCPFFAPGMGYWRIDPLAVSRLPMALAFISVNQRIPCLSRARSLGALGRLKILPALLGSGMWRVGKGYVLYCPVWGK